MTIVLAAGFALIAVAVADYVSASTEHKRHGAREDRERDVNDAFYAGMRCGAVARDQELYARLMSITDLDEFTSKRLQKAEAPGRYPDAS